MSDLKPIIQYKRNGIPEKIYLGSAVVLEQNRNIKFEYGDIKTPVLFRSAQKPFQTYELLNSGAYKHYKLTPKHLAVMSASHIGTVKHIKLLREVLHACKLSEKYLQTPKSYPLDKKTKSYMVKNNIKPKKITHNCSGKHIAMLCNCRYMDYDLENYKELNHPLQQKIIQNTLAFCEFEKIIPAKDGCGVPVLAVPLENMATGIQNLYKDTSGQKIINSALKYPWYFGGIKRLDSEIISVTNGRIFAKVGAEGLCIGINTQTQEAFSVKIFADDMPMRAGLVLYLFKKLNWLYDEEILEFKNLYPNTFLSDNVEIFF